MHSTCVRAGGVLLICCLMAVAPQAGETTGQAPHSDVVFIPNNGQWPDAVLFMARTGPMTTWFESDGWTFTLEQVRPPAEGDVTDEGEVKGVAVSMKFREASDATGVHGIGAPGATHNYAQGGERVASARSYNRLRYDSIYPGVDVVVRPHDGRIEYDVCLDAGADLSQVAITADGIEGFTIEDDGALVMQTTMGPVRQPAPRTWAEGPDGLVQMVTCRFRVIDEDTWGFEVPEWNGSGRLVIDPELRWSSYLGGSNFDYIMDMESDALGNVTVAGFTTFTGFPTSVGAYDATFNGSRDVFVSRMTPDGTTLLFSTYIGGSNSEEPVGMVLDDDGGVIVTGYTASGNFPTTVGAYDRSFSGGGALLGSDAFVFHLDENGENLLFSTYLGGSSDETGVAVDVALDGTVFVTGRTSSSDFTTTAGAFDTTYNGGGPEVGDTFVVRLTADGSDALFSTFLGGAANDNPKDMMLDHAGMPVVVGWTMSPGYPTTPGVHDTVHTGFSDAYITRLLPDGSDVDMSTFLGGVGDDSASALWIDDQARLVVTGTTLSNNFPTTPNAFQSTYGGGGFHGDSFVVCLDYAASTLQYASYLGGSGDDYATCVRSDAAGSFIVAGWTGSADFPLSPDAVDATLGGSTDAFVALIEVDQLLYSTLMGGNSVDKVTGMSLTPSGEVSLAGWTTSSAFPVTAGSYDETFDGFEGFISDAFVARVDVGAQPQFQGTFVDMGFSLAGQGGVEPRMTWTGGLAPEDEGSVNFDGAAPNTFGVVFMGFAPGMVAFKEGIFVPFPYALFVILTTDSEGDVSVAYEWPADVPSDLDMYVQAWFLDAGGPAGFSATNSMQVTTP